MLSVVLAALAFGSIIFIHELGHYLAARRVGIRVLKFYLGFDFWGMKLFKFHHNGTEYGIGIFPLGGYVQMAGMEEMGRAVVDGKPDEFPSKTIWQRIQVLSAGVVFNFISAFAFSALAFMLGYELKSTEVGEIQVGSAAWYSDLKKGDKILKINGFATNSQMDVHTEIVLGGAGKVSQLEVLRDGKIVEIEVVPKKGSMKGIAELGAESALSTQVNSLTKNSPAGKAGIKLNDIIIAIDGEDIKEWSQIREHVGRAGVAGRSITVKILRDTEIKTIVLTPKLRDRGEIGVSPLLDNTILGVKPKSIAEKLGIAKGMKLTHINGVEVSRSLEFIKEGESPLNLRLLQEGKEKHYIFEGSKKQLLRELHIELNPEKVVIGKIKAGMAAEKMGLKSGDEVLEFQVEDQIKISNNLSWYRFLAFIGVGMNKKLDLLVDRGGEKIKLSGVIGQVLADDPRNYLMGIGSSIKTQEGASLSSTLWWPLSMLRTSYKSVLSLVSGGLSVKHLSGPKGIWDVTYQAAQVGLSYLFYLMAFISVNIAFMNILPIPALDGGHLLFCFIEAIKGSPVNEKAMQYIQTAGVAFLLTLIIFATYNDFT